MNVDIAQILTQAIGFFLLVTVLKKIAWGPILSMLDERRDRIVSDFDEIEKSKEELASLKVDYEARLSAIDEQAHAKIQEAGDKAEGISRKIIEEAREESVKILEKAQENVNLEIQNAKDQIRNEIVKLSLLAAGRILNVELDEAKHSEIISTTIGEVKEF